MAYGQAQNPRRQTIQSFTHFTARRMVAENRHMDINFTVTTILPWLPYRLPFGATTITTRIAHGSSNQTMTICSMKQKKKQTHAESASLMRPGGNCVVTAVQISWRDLCRIFAFDVIGEETILNFTFLDLGTDDVTNGDKALQH